MKATTLNEAAIKSLCNAVMVGVANALRGRAVDYDRACSIMREEVKGFFYGAEYAEERVCILKRSVDERVVVASIIARCIERILK